MENSVEVNILFVCSKPLSPSITPVGKSGDKLTGDMGGRHVNAESGFGTEVSAFFLSFSSMDQNICYGVRFLCGAKVARRYVVPTGRVKVPAGSVVPTGKDSSIVSTGSTKVIPAGRTILVLVVLCLLRVVSKVS
ncbi:hypothetical protein Tco_0011827 [Tanacetum coccineum]